MYKVNEIVMYETQRVCKIMEISERDVRGEAVSYYVLKPIYDNSAVLFVPVDSDAAHTKIREILSAEEIHALISSLPEENLAWLNDDKRFRDRCRDVLSIGDRTEVLKLIKALNLHIHRHVHKMPGKPSGARENSMKDAAKMLYEEFSYVLKIRCDQVLPFILEQMQISTSSETESK